VLGVVPIVTYYLKLIVMFRCLVIWSDDFSQFNVFVIFLVWLGVSGCPAVFRDKVSATPHVGLSMSQTLLTDVLFLCILIVVLVDFFDNMEKMVVSRRRLAQPHRSRPPAASVPL
jgi:hypothetical protein